MPKIIENVKEQLLQEAKKQIAEHGYGQTTIRSVAKACGLGVGTVYNYFPSKDMLIASFMAEDWKQCLRETESLAPQDAKGLLESVHDSIVSFMQKYHALFCDSDAVKVYASALSVRHKQLRAQLAERILPVCEGAMVKDQVFLSEWLAEALLTWTVAGKDFDEQYEIIKQFIK